MVEGESLLPSLCVSYPRAFENRSPDLPVFCALRYGDSRPAGGLSARGPASRAEPCRYVSRHSGSLR